MLIQNIGTVVLSVGCSVLAILLVDQPLKRQVSGPVRAQKIELVDEEERLRGAFKIEKFTDGGALPELSMWDGAVEEAVLVRLDYRGMGQLAISSWEDRAVLDGVQLGYLQLDDTVPHSKQFTGWGIKVQNQRKASFGSTTGMAIMDSGRREDPSTLPVADEPGSK